MEVDIQAIKAYILDFVKNEVVPISKHKNIDMIDILRKKIIKHFKIEDRKELIIFIDLCAAAQYSLLTESTIDIEAVMPLILRQKKLMFPNINTFNKLKDEKFVFKLLMSSRDYKDTVFNIMNSWIDCPEENEIENAILVLDKIFTDYNIDNEMLKMPNIQELLFLTEHKITNHFSVGSKSNFDKFLLSNLECNELDQVLNYEFIIQVISENVWELIERIINGKMGITESSWLLTNIFENSILETDFSEHEARYELSPKLISKTIELIVSVVELEIITILIRRLFNSVGKAEINIMPRIAIAVNPFLIKFK